MTIDYNRLLEFQKNYHKDPMNQFWQNAIFMNGIDRVCYNFERKKINLNFFNVEIAKGKIANQEKSGLCWLQAGLNLLKRDMAAQLHMDPLAFSLSTTYLSFFDKLEKCNGIYEMIIRSTSCDFQFFNRQQFLLFDEGGFFEYFVSLVTKYGVVLEEVMPSTYDSVSSLALLEVLQEKVKRDASILLRMKRQKAGLLALQEKSKEMLQEDYGILAKTLGEPVTEFSLEYYNQEGHLVQGGVMSPLTFFKKYCTLSLNDFYVFGNLPSHYTKYYQKYQVKYKASVFGKSKVEFLNLPIDEMKQMVVAQLKGGMPVWFGADIRKMRNLEEGILDSQLYSYEAAFGFSLLDKEENVNLCNTSCNHAMNFVGVHLEEERPVRWKVENNWGEAFHQGYLIMNDNFFDQFVFEVVIHKDYIPHKYFNLLKGKVKTLPLQNPFL